MPVSARVSNTDEHGEPAGAADRQPGVAAPAHVERGLQRVDRRALGRWIELAPRLRRAAAPRRRTRNHTPSRVRVSGGISAWPAPAFPAGSAAERFQQGRGGEARSATLFGAVRRASPRRADACRASHGQQELRYGSSASSTADGSNAVVGLLEMPGQSLRRASTTCN